MVWFFERGGEVCRVETRSDAATGQFVVEITRPDGAVESERYDTRALFQERLNALEAQLQADSWIHAGTGVLPAEWRGPIN